MGSNPEGFYEFLDKIPVDLYTLHDIVLKTSYDICCELQKKNKKTYKTWQLEIEEFLLQC